MTLIGHVHSSQLMEWQNLGITTLKHAKYTPNVFKKLPENRRTVDLIYQTSSNFVTISHKSVRRKIYGNSGMVHFAEINQAPLPTQCCRILEE